MMRDVLQRVTIGVSLSVSLRNESIYVARAVAPLHAQSMWLPSIHSKYTPFLNYYK
jgi:hypothetical protein